MKLYNTLTRKKEVFTPLGDEVKLYTCGPTVYDYAHIGNLRTYVSADILKRSLKHVEGYIVRHVMNITDVDDKTIGKSGGDQEELRKLTKKYEKYFFSDLHDLNIDLPDDENITRATLYVEKMAQFVKELIDMDYAYRGEDGSIYFSIEKFEGYGKLSGLKQEDLKVGARVDQQEYTKENPADFVLWKAWDKEDGDIYWDTVVGKGRPGWHLECSVMAQDKLGDMLDIHVGGVDLIFPHHENEIAQAEAVSKKPFSRFWVHMEHLLVDGKKMSKSLGNFYRLSDIVDRGFSPLDFRYLCLQSHYRSKMNFTWEALDAARNARQRLAKLVFGFKDDSGKQVDSANKYFQRHKDYVSNDLDTPKALANLWECLRESDVTGGEKYDFALMADEVFGLGLDKESRKKSDIPKEIREKFLSYQKARKNKDYNLSDSLRKELLGLGYRVEDTKEGSKISKEA